MYSTIINKIIINYTIKLKLKSKFANFVPKTIPIPMEATIFRARYFMYLCNVIIIYIINVRATRVYESF